MILSKAVRKFSHDMAIKELRLQNANYSDTKLTYNSVLYLDIISAHPGEYTASNIADMLHVARPSVTQKLNDLERMGYIEKKQSNEDKRIYYLFTTKKAFPFESEYIQSDEWVENQLLKKYSSTEIETFCEMLSLVGNAYLVDDEA